MSTPTAVVADLIRRRYYPAGNVHAPEYPNRYVGGSRLVKSTAVEYAERLLAQKEGRPWEEADRSKGYYSFRGNTIAGGAFADAQASEIRVEVPLGIFAHPDVRDEPWHLVIHPDAIYVVDDRFVVIGEHKDHGEETGWKTQLAYRQGALGLACLYKAARDALATGVSSVVFEGAAWAPDHLFEWREGYEPAGVVVGIATQDGGTPHEFPLSWSQLVDTPDSFLNFYTEKARRIVQAAVTGDLAPCEEWDRDAALGGAEHLRDFAEVRAGPKELAPLMEEYDRARAAAKEADENKKRLSAEILLALDTGGMTACDSVPGTDLYIAGIKLAGGQRFADCDALERDGLHGYVRKAAQSRYPDVRRRNGKKAKKAEEAVA